MAVLISETVMVLLLLRADTVEARRENIDILVVTFRRRLGTLLQMEFAVSSRQTNMRV